jgi:hypothetical protein
MDKIKVVELRRQFFEERDALLGEIEKLKFTHEEELSAFRRETSAAHKKFKTEIEKLKANEEKYKKQLKDSYNVLQDERKKSADMAEKLQVMEAMMEQQAILLSKRDSAIEARNQELEKLRISGGNVEVIKQMEENVKLLREMNGMMAKNKEEQDERLKTLQEEKKQSDALLREKEAFLEQVMLQMAATVNQIGKDVSHARNELSSLMASEEERDGCPRIFELIKQEQSYFFNPKAFITAKFRLRFLCAYDFTPAECGDDGKGYLIEISNQFAKKIGPAIEVTAMVMKLVTVAGKVVSGLELPLPDVGGMLDNANLASAKWDLIANSWPQQDDIAGEDGNFKSKDELEGAAYRALNQQIRDIDQGLLNIGMVVETSKDGLVKWVKIANREKFKASNHVTRGAEIGLFSEAEADRYVPGASIVLGGEKAQKAYEKVVEKSAEKRKSFFRKKKK